MICGRAERAFRGEVEVFEGRPIAEPGGFDAIGGFSLLPVIDFGLHQLIEQLAATELIAGGLGERVVQDAEHAEQLHLGQLISSRVQYS